ncbi:hypothetical protein M3I54_11880 [Paraburkholderia sp. CNPSo 3274]|uniref:hypothetical protein n=1 Tax=Paraburkholderia sp. CNPSo 3274 TaxID=2940932 RepID=UPI0020B6AB93|nr:hypothetical protein [Paraburkholderia sp. CNPSo 3274]MCP3707677.1 hypothetical protein [Paraburkholderia sp. CNPSo 3274]
MTIIPPSAVKAKSGFVRGEREGGMPVGGVVLRADVVVDRCQRLGLQRLRERRNQLKKWRQPIDLHKTAISESLKFRRHQYTPTMRVPRT